jgi:glycine oxidase
MHVLIAGGGVVGCAIAYELSRAGAEVTLVERGRIGAGASSAAAGMLAPLAESSDPGAFSRLALLGLDAFDRQSGELVEESGIDFEFRYDGVLRVAESATEEKRLQGLVAWQSEQRAAHWLDRLALTQVEPNLSEKVRGALYSPQEGHVNPSRLTAALANAAARRGAAILEGHEIVGIDRKGRRVTAVDTSKGVLAADQFVLAGGAWMGRLSAGSGFNLPITPVRGQMLAVHRTPAPIRHIVYSKDGYLLPKPDGSIWVGATEEHDAGFDASVTVDGMRTLLGSAVRLVPDLADASYIRSWAGLRPHFADGLPVLGPVRDFDNLHVAAGHFRNGILLSLITGRLMADLITSGIPPPELTPFLPDRFS